MKALVPHASALPQGPLFGNQGAYDLGANTVAPLADEAAKQAIIGRALAAVGALGCLARAGQYGRGAQVLGDAAKGAQIGLGLKQSIDSAQGLNDALAQGDSVGLAKNALGLAGGLLNTVAGLLTSCFAAGTPIVTPEGSKLIEDIRPGDWVMAAPDDDPFADPVPRQVEETFENYSPTLDLQVNSRTIRTTAEHPFWVRGRGWVGAQQLEVGNELRTNDGHWLEVERIEGPMPPAPVYNMCVAEYHTYFVGHQIWGFAVWSHNLGINCLRLREPKTGRFVSDPANPPSPYRMTDAQRRKAWKNLAQDPNSPLNPEQRAQVESRGWRGPQQLNEYGEPETMELSHEPIPLREGGTDVVPRWPADHAANDPFRFLKTR